MTRWPFKLLLLLSVATVYNYYLIALIPGVMAAKGPKNFTILPVGYLTAIRGDLKSRQGLTVSGAITMALDEVNQDENLLKGIFLKLQWNDTKSDTVVATRAITEMICEGIFAIFGPEGPCHVEAIVAQSRNIPMISYVSDFCLNIFFHFSTRVLVGRIRCSIASCAMLLWILIAILFTSRKYCSHNRN